MKKEDLRIVFMGTPEFAVPTLDAIVKSGFNVVGVITAPDRKAGRGRKITMSAVKEYALKNDIRVLQPLNLKNDEFYNELAGLNPNLQVVVAFRMLPKKIWSLPEFGTFNLHASLLPQYRGAAPINFALINGETKTGLTTFFLDEEIDTGRIIDQISVDIDYNDNVGTLHDKLMNMGGEFVVRTIFSIIDGRIQPRDQNKSIDNLRSAPKLFKEDCKINWNSSPDSIYNFVRGLSPYPSAFSNLVSANGDETTVKIYSTVIISDKEQDLSIGTIITDEKTYLNVVVYSGIIGIEELQISGKKRLNIVDFLRGFNNIVDYQFK